MNFLRTAFSCAVIAAPCLYPMQAEAQAYPQRAVTVVVPVAAGGAADALARSWAEYAARILGQPVVVENKAGANGAVAAAYVAKQPADGHTLLFGSTSNMSLNPFSYKKLAYNPTRDFDPVTMVARTSQVLITSSETGIRTLDELVSAVRAKPGVMNFGSAGKGNSTHLNNEYMLEHFKVKATHIAYKGAAPAMVGLLGGETQFMSDALSSVVPQVKAGRVVPLLVFGERRAADFPHVPTVREAGMKDFPSSGWYGLMVPRGTPKTVIVRLNETNAKYWADPQVQVRMNELHMHVPAELGPDAVAQAMKIEAKVWGPIIEKLDIKND